MELFFTVFVAMLTGAFVVTIVALCTLAFFLAHVLPVNGTPPNDAELEAARAFAASGRDDLDLTFLHARPELRADPSDSRPRMRQDAPGAPPATRLGRPPCRFCAWVRRHAKLPLGGGS